MKNIHKASSEITQPSSGVLIILLGAALLLIVLVLYSGLDSPSSERHASETVEASPVPIAELNDALAGKVQLPIQLTALPPAVTPGPLGAEPVEQQSDSPESETERGNVVQASFPLPLPDDPRKRIHSVAVVDVARLLQAQGIPTEDSDFKRSILRRIETAIQKQASAHASSLVFDISGHSLNGAPVVFGSPRAIDLTEEVREELAGAADVK